MFVNYAHRGASAYAPENTLSAFYLGLTMKANGIETDVRRSKDGKLVLFHDNTLEKTAGITGSVGDYTLKELREMMIYGQPGFVPDHIVTLEEFLYRFGYRELTFAIEIKEQEVEAEILELTRRFGVVDKCIFTSFIHDSLVELRKLDEKICLGYLFRKLTEKNLEDAKKVNCMQICPKADTLNEENVKRLKAEGFSIRAWGVTDESLMEHCLDVGVDGGMTVNFPDRLTAAMEARGL